MEEIAYATVNRQYQDWQFYSESGSEVVSLAPQEHARRPAQSQANRPSGHSFQPGKQASKSTPAAEQEPRAPVSLTQPKGTTSVASSKSIGAWMSLSKSDDNYTSKQSTATTQTEPRRTPRAEGDANKQLSHNTVKQDTWHARVKLPESPQQKRKPYTTGPEGMKLPQSKSDLDRRSKPAAPNSPAASAPESSQVLPSTNVELTKCVLCSKVIRLTQLREHYWRRHSPCCGRVFRRGQDQATFADHLRMHCNKSRTVDGVAAYDAVTLAFVVGSGLRD